MLNPNDVKLANAPVKSHVSVSTVVEGNEIVRRTYRDGRVICSQREPATPANLAAMGMVR